MRRETLRHIHAHTTRERVCLGPGLNTVSFQRERSLSEWVRVRALSTTTTTRAAAAYLIGPDQIGAQVLQTSEQGSRILPLCGEVSQGWAICVQWIGSVQLKFIVMFQLIINKRSTKKHTILIVTFQLDCHSWQIFAGSCVRLKVDSTTCRSTNFIYWVPMIYRKKKRRKAPTSKVWCLRCQTNHKVGSDDTGSISSLFP